MTTNDQTCKPIQFTNFMKLRGTDKAYLEALEASSKFNRRLIVDRKTRIPFIDSQTRVAQTNSLVWYLRYQREKSDKNEQVYTYPVKNWVKKRRLQYDIDPNLMIRLPSYEQAAQQLNENSNSTDSLMQPSLTRQSTILLDQDVIEQSQTPTSASASSAQQQSQQQQQLQQQQQSSKYIDDWHMQDDSFDYYNDPPENDNESDFDDYEEKKSKKKKGGKGTGKKRSEISNDEKPFVCDKCGVKYKTKPGLTYHVHKMHSANATGGASTADATVTPQHDQVAQAIHSRVSSVTKMSECINSDENTNSLLDSAYDDSNHHNPPLQSASATSTQLKQPPVAGGSGSQTNTKLCTNCGYGPLDQESKCLVSCCECTRSYHPICLNFSTNMISSVRKYNWQCIECKKCTICGNSENDDKLLFCDDCDRGYHMYCLNPPLSDAPAGDWRCDLCVQQFGPQ